MSDLNLKIRISAITQGLKNAINSAKTTVQSFGKSTKQAGTEGSRSMGGLARSLKSDVKGAAREARGEVNKLGQAIGRTSKRMGGLAKAAIATVTVGLGSWFVKATTASDSLTKGLELLTGSGEAAQQEMEYLSAAAKQLGIPLREAGKAYLDLYAATKGTSLEGQATRDIFTSVSRAMAKLGRSSADTAGALRAVQQIVSKGTVSAEELRGQLGERLPGAFQAAARAMGVTTQELGKMLENGELMAEDLLPKLSKELDRTFDDGQEVTTLIAGWERFKNVIETTMEQFGKTGSLAVVVKLLGYVGTLISAIGVGLVTVTEKAKAAAISIKGFFDYVTRDIDYTEFEARVAGAFETADENIRKAAKAIFDMDGNLSAFEKTLSRVSRSDSGKGVGGNIAANTRKNNREIKKALKEQEKIFRDHKRRLDEIELESKAVADEFRGLIDELQGATGEDVDYIDVAAKRLEARNALINGNAEQAVKLSREGGEMLRQLKENGEGTSVALVGLAKDLERIAKEANQKQHTDALIDAQRVHEEIKKIQSNIDSIGKIKVELDQASAAASYDQVIKSVQAKGPIEIPVKYVPINEPGVVSSVSGGNVANFTSRAVADEIAREADRRGS